MRASLTRRFFLSALTLLAALPASTRAANMTLEQLLQPGAFIQSGDKKFHGFENYVQSGSLNIPSSRIEVVPIQNTVPGANEPEYGVRFVTEGGWELEGSNLLYNMSVDFLVTATRDGWFISDNTLEITGNHVGGGEAHLVEGVTDFATGATLANKEVYINLENSGVDKLIDHQVFINNAIAKTVKISKGFELQTRGSAEDNIFIAHFDQTFSQVPEPGSVILMGIGALGLVGYRLRKRHDRKVD